MEIAGVSSIQMGASERSPAAWVNLGQSVSERKPVLNRWASTLASDQNSLWAICSFEVSRLKIATGIFNSMATCCAILRAKDVFPMEGLEAMTTRSDG